MNYITEIRNIFGGHLQEVILFGSYARGDFRNDSDIDIMILVDLDDMAAKEYQDQVCDETYDFNLENQVDIRPIIKNETHFRKWVNVYPFYSNVNREGVKIFDAA